MFSRCNLFYNTRMVKNVRHLRFKDIAPSGAMHAALFTLKPPRGYTVALHDHDFYEILFVLAGGARHEVNGDEGTLRPGDLVFLRPPDCHAIHVAPRQKLHHINVAFPADTWRAFSGMVGDLSISWEQAPVFVSVPEERRAACAVVFEAALHAFARQPSPTQRLDLCRFLADALPFLLHSSAGSDTLPLDPPWLADACRSFRRDLVALQAGVPRLVALSGVSPSHLARTLKAATGQTPTEYVTRLRLARAATLLVTTALPITEIAADCGFGQLSYFYRRFGICYGTSPHVYRQKARRSVAP